MQLPINEKERINVQAYLRSRQGDVGFMNIFIPWIKSELQRLDEGNRYVGQENKTSEAQGFSDLLKLVAACQALEADRNKTESGAGSTSAQPLT